MENNLYLNLKKRMLDEVNASLQRHSLYKADVKAFGKYHMGQERPQVGISLMGASGSRITLSPDDTLGDLLSLVTMSKVGDKPGTSIEWVWEDVYNISRRIVKENVSSTRSTDGYKVHTVKPLLTQGAQNPNLLTSVGQIELFINGTPVIPRNVNAKTGEILLFAPVLSTDLVEVTYFYKNIDLPGYYYLEMTTPDQFVITPMHTEDGELVLSDATGVELTAHLQKTPVLIDFVLSLYFKMSSSSPKIFLERDKDYTIASTGLITFLVPLPEKCSLFASYRWQGANRGPFNIPSDYSYNSVAIKGVTLAFGSRREAGDKMCVILTSNRERAAQVKGGHYLMNLEWKVFARDPMTASEIADHVAADIWANRKEPLRSEGITMQECLPSGESESAYDDATQTMYFESTITMEIMTEWKKFIPYIIRIRKYKASLIVNDPTDLYPMSQEFAIHYPITGYPSIF